MTSRLKTGKPVTFFLQCSRRQGKEPKSSLSGCVGGVQYCMCVCQLVMLEDREDPGMGESLCMCESESERD